ncbi:MAG: N-formylglutamate amidohydrolase [Euryhalocaulis sp.]|nr:N-formylglutamate amidohydrolase [Euryhalocaulis sp.]
MSAEHGQPVQPVDVFRPAEDCAPAPLVFASPHSGEYAPQAFFDEIEVDRHAVRTSEDAFVDQLFQTAPEFGATLVRANFARAYIDPNRDPWELDPKMFRDALPAWANPRSPRVANGLGAIPRVVADGRGIYRRLLRLEEAVARIEQFHDPYHDALDAELERLRRDHGFAILIDCHSMPSGSGGRADIVLGDRFGASCDAQLSGAVEMTLRTLGYRVTRNAPYAGGYTTSRYGRPQAGIHALQIELCRSLYMNEAEIAPRQPRFDRMRRRMTRLIGILCEIDWEARLRDPEKKQPRLRAAE